MSNPENQNPQGQQQLEIELNEEVAEGVYCNFAIITHSNTEFILDIIRILPGIPKARVKSRVILAPEHAKRLMMALGENIARYEETFGEIEINEGFNSPGIPMNFGGQTGMA